eukprot:tig00020629_g12391.t1
MYILIFIFRVLFQIRVWGRALDSSEIAASRFRRIRSGADNYTTNFSDLKINLPLDSGAPGTDFNVSTIINDADCSPKPLTAVQNGSARWVQSDPGFCSGFHGGVLPANYTARTCPAAVDKSEIPCSEIRPDAGGSVKLELTTDEDYTRSFFVSETQGMTVEFWARLGRFNATSPASAVSLLTSTGVTDRG